ncbi:16S rRNA (cytidine(1402)-2'-O)-methyltransferase [Arcobacter sp. YIC-464]|uniref:16S rRNA (cytidine(1402)-2'-O)-methyltransferase n=1 Tax=Arcobacter sp. YIC-464 TaxID=3376631 RepID=UPI003C2130C6
MLTLVPTPIGNLEDISLRALNTLLEAELIFCEDTRVTKKLLNLLGEKNNLDFSNKEYKSFHSHNENQILKTLTTETFTKNVVYVSDAGMPCVSDPGATLVDFCINNDIKYDVLPGANAVLTAYAMSGFTNTTFAFHGFLAHKGNERTSKLDAILNDDKLAILYESPHRLLKLLEELAKKDENRTIFLVKEISKLYQTTYKNSAKNLYEEFKTITIKGEWVVVIEAVEKTGEALSIKDIEDLDIPPKIKAKLLSKMTGRKTKEIYQELM